ncbi:hypothetical protein GO497_01320 [Acidovorax citrulli]|nr:hypothetical protein [Paracidovorax citrulli]
MVGDWCGGKARSFYVGTKEVGKQTNVYEKGHQLFGDADTSAWIRAELRWGNKARFLPIEMLRCPADFFHGASDWHASPAQGGRSNFVPGNRALRAQAPD